jgi:hypothetical protein
VNAKAATETATQRVTIVKKLAQKLRSDGFKVLANYAEWADGHPLPVFGVVPDIVATRGHQRYTVLIEDESCLIHPEQVRERVTGLLRLPRLNVYVMVPAQITWEGRSINPVRYMRERLQNGGYKVKIGTYDKDNGSCNFNPWKD